VSADDPVPGQAPSPPARAAASPRPAMPPPPLIVGSGARHSVELGGGKGSVATRRVNQRAAVPEGGAGPPFAPLAVPPMPAAEAAAARRFESLPEPASPRAAEAPAPPPAVVSGDVAPAVDAAPVDAPPVDAATVDTPPPASDAFARRLQALRETTRQRRAALERLQRR
jgi:hypothetical protein